MARDPREVSSAWRKYQQHAVAVPSPDLGHYVERYWAVAWDYPEPYRQLIVPYPNVHLTFRNGAATIQGVWTGHQVKVLEGVGSVFGVAFRPGCFRPFLGRPVSSITNAVLDAEDVFGHVARELFQATDGVTKDTVEGVLRSNPPHPDPKTWHAAEAVATIAANPSLTRVDAVARELDTSVRQLQRLFAGYVGVGPKWVIRRYRLHDVTERLAAGVEIDWAALAGELGYADQSHFVHDFTDMFGETPTHYAARY